MRFPKPSKFTLISFFVLIIFAFVSLTSLMIRVNNAKAAQQEIKRAVTEQEVKNAELEYRINNSDDDETIADIARDSLGLKLPGEKVFHGEGQDEATGVPDAAGEGAP